MLTNNATAEADLAQARIRTLPGDAALRALYCAAPQSDWALSRKVWTVIGCASASWVAVFGCAALVLGA